MKKSMIAGIVTGVGVCLCAFAGAQKPILSWLDCALIVGIALMISGAVVLYGEIRS